MAQNALSGRLNELQGADPGAILRKFTEMKQEVVQLIPQVAFTLPGVSKHMSNLWKALDGAIKEAEQAVTTQQAAQSTPGAQGGGQPPLGFSAAQPPQAQQSPGGGGGGQPPQGGSPFMQGGGM
jgi:hypothetical protein